MADPLVLVVGSLHYDIVIGAPHLPAVDETVMGGPVRFVCGGKGGNQAVSAARHGARTAMAARIGDDFLGRQLRENLADAGVETTLLQQDDRMASGMSVAIVDQNADYGAVVASGANQALDVNRIDISGDTGLLLLQNEIPESVNLAVAAKARLAGVAVMLNAAPMRDMVPDLLAAVDILILNRVEGRAFLGAAHADRDEFASLIERRGEGPDRLVVTLGSDGVLSHCLGEDVQYHDAYEVEAQSTHGAGDCFVGALAASLVRGRPWSKALDYAQAAAALFVTAEPGHAVADEAQIEAMLSTP